MTQPTPSPAADTRAEIAAAADYLAHLIGQAVDDTRDLSLAEALEHEWDGRLATLAAAIDPLGLLALDERRADRDATEMREFARAAA